jgi:hypothetical protein
MNELSMLLSICCQATDRHYVVQVIDSVDIIVPLLLVVLLLLLLLLPLLTRQPLCPALSEHFISSRNWERSNEQMLLTMNVKPRASCELGRDKTVSNETYLVGQWFEHKNKHGKCLLIFSSKTATNPFVFQNSTFIYIFILPNTAIRPWLRQGKQANSVSYPSAILLE